MKRLFLVMPMLVACSVAFGQIDKMLGYWVSVDENTGAKESVFYIYKATNGKYYGKVTDILLPEFYNAVCDKCEGSDKGKRVLGMDLMKDLKASDSKLVGGTIIDPRSGKKYRCRISYDAKTDQLRLRGSLDKMGLLGRTQVWNRKK